MQTTQQKNHNNVACLRAREHSIVHHVYVHIKEHNHRSYVADSGSERDSVTDQPFEKLFTLYLCCYPYITDSRYSLTIY